MLRKVNAHPVNIDESKAVLIRNRTVNASPMLHCIFTRFALIEVIGTYKVIW